MGWKPSLGTVANSCWALLARGTPSLSNGGATVEFSTHYGGNLVCACIVGPCKETWSFAVISLASHASESVDTSTSSGSYASSSVKTSRSTDRLPAVGSSVAVCALTLVVDALSTVHTSDSAFLLGTFHVASRFKFAVFAQARVWSLAQSASTSALVTYRSKAHFAGVGNSPSWTAE